MPDCRTTFEVDLPDKVTVTTAYDTNRYIDYGLPK